MEEQPPVEGATGRGVPPTPGESWTAYLKRAPGPGLEEFVGRESLRALAVLHAAGQVVDGEVGERIRWVSQDDGDRWRAKGRTPEDEKSDTLRRADLLNWAIACHRSIGHSVESALRSRRGGSGDAVLRLRLQRLLPDEPPEWTSAFSRAVLAAVRGTASSAAPLYGVLMFEGEEAPVWEWGTWAAWQDMQTGAGASASPLRSSLPRLRRATVAILLVAITSALLGLTAQWLGKWRPPLCDADSECGADLCTDGVCTPAGFVYIPSTSLVVGSPPGEPGREPRVEGQFSATITRGYYLQATEVTQGDWERFTGSRPSYFASCGQRCPVDSVNWYEAVAFANARSRVEGLTQCYVAHRCRGELGSGCESTEPRLEHGCGGDYHCERVEFVGLECNGYRLPTEVEWENGARAGTMTATWWGPLEVNERGTVQGSSFEGRARVAGTDVVRRSDLAEAWPCALAQNETCGPGDVATLDPNQWGLHDMLGGVSEWTHDAWVGYPSEAVVDRVADDEEATSRLVRGGAWYHTPDTARAAQRRRPSARTRWYDVGFRLARTAILSSEL
ncbi:MAG: sulfatase modifying factor 1 [Bradymonadia bacterium]